MSLIGPRTYPSQKKQYYDFYYQDYTYSYPIQVAVLIPPELFVEDVAIDVGVGVDSAATFPPPQTTAILPNTRNTTLNPKNMSANFFEPFISGTSLVIT